MGKHGKLAVRRWIKAEGMNSLEALMLACFCPLSHQQCYGELHYITSLLTNTKRLEDFLDC